MTIAEAPAMDPGSRRASTRLAWWRYAAGSIVLVASLGLRVLNGRLTAPSDITKQLAFLSQPPV